MIDWEDIKARHRIEDVLTKRGFTLRRSGSGFLMKCPLHKEEKGESFSIDTKKQIWKCFGKCQCGGDVLKLVMELDMLDATGAAEILEGRPLRHGQHVESSAKKERPPRPPVVSAPRELPHLPGKFWKGKPEHWETVENLRKLPHAGGIEMMVTQGVLRFCLAYECPAWAVLDVENPCNVQVRRMDGALWFERAKVMGIKGNWAAWPVGLHAAMNIGAAELVLVEGTGDFVAAWHAAVEGLHSGIPVAMFGASNAIHPGALTLMQGLGARVRIIEQHDDAGAKASERWRAQIEEAGLECCIRRVPTPGEDLNDHLSAGRDDGGLWEWPESAAS